MVIGQTVATTEVLVIGAGPGGYVAAIRLAQLGYEVMLADKAGELGGMCLHHGCIPSKALIHATDVLYTAQRAQKIGISGQLTLNFPTTQQWKHEVINKLADGIGGLCKRHGIRVVKGEISFQSSTVAIVRGENLDFNAIEFRYAIIATGSKPRPLASAPFGGNILSSREAIELDHIPATLAVIGGGYIGIELGGMFAKAGSKVTVLENTDSVLALLEPEVNAAAVKRLQSIGIDIRVNAAVERAESTADGAIVVSAGQTLSFSKVLVAIGHAPITDNLQVEMAGIQKNEKGFIPVDAQCRTNVRNIYAVGDVTGGVMLAHKASAQGRVAAEAIAGKPVAFEPRGIPAVVFSDPEIAMVGLRTKEAVAEYGEVRVGTFPFSALGRALAIDEPDGFVKIISTKEGVVIGVHAIGPGVSDIVSEAALAIEMGARAEDIALTIHPHPTLGESLAEAAEALLGQSIHIYQPKQ